MSFYRVYRQVNIPDLVDDPGAVALALIQDDDGVIHAVHPPKYRAFVADMYRVDARRDWPVSDDPDVRLNAFIGGHVPQTWEWGDVIEDRRPWEAIAADLAALV